jgi:hypothetical protein
MNGTTETTTLRRARCLTCKAIIPDPQEVNQAKLDAGMTRDQVIAEYGCPRCGTAFVLAFVNSGWSPVAIKGVRTASACDTACATATSAVCKCECGGMNHGTRA